jgi:hypothetical protein
MNASSPLFYFQWPDFSPRFGILVGLFVKVYRQVESIETFRKIVEAKKEMKSKEPCQARTALPNENEFEKETKIRAEIQDQEKRCFQEAEPGPKVEVLEKRENEVKKEKADTKKKAAS